MNFKTKIYVASLLILSFFIAPTTSWLHAQGDVGASIKLGDPNRNDKISLAQISNIPATWTIEFQCQVELGVADGTVLLFTSNAYDCNAIRVVLTTNNTVHLLTGSKCEPTYWAQTNDYQITSGWHNYTITYDGTNMSFYIDQNLKETLSSPPMPTEGTTWPNVEFAHKESGTTTFSGWFDEIRIWGLAKDENYVDLNYNQELIDIAAATNLLAYYNFNDCSPGGGNQNLRVVSNLVPNGQGYAILQSVVLTGTTSNYVASSPFHHAGVRNSTGLDCYNMYIGQPGQESSVVGQTFRIGNAGEQYTLDYGTFALCAPDVSNIGSWGQIGIFEVDPKPTSTEWLLGDMKSRLGNITYLGPLSLNGTTNGPAGKEYLMEYYHSQAPANTVVLDGGKLYAFIAFSNGNVSHAYLNSGDVLNNSTGCANCFAFRIPLNEGEMPTKGAELGTDSDKDLRFYLQANKN